MGGLALILFFAAPFVTYLVHARTKDRELRLLKSAKWAEVGQNLGLELDPNVRGAWPELGGERQGFTVGVRFLDSGEAEISISSPRLPQALHIERNQARPGGPDPKRSIQTGDPRFDQKCAVYGRKSLVMALLDPDTRSALLQLVFQYRGQVSASEITLKQQDGVDRGAEELVEAVELGLCVARALSQLHGSKDLEARINERLLQLLASEEERGVRRKLFQLLRWRLEENAQEQLLVHCLQDQDPELRFEAAKMVGDAAQLSALYEDRDLSAKLRARALEALMDVQQVSSALLLEALEAPSEIVQRAAVLGLGRAPSDAKSAAALGALLSRTENEALCQDILEVLQDLRDPAVEPQVCALLQSLKPQIQRAAIRALAALGTARSLPALKRMLEQERAFSDRKKALKQAIAQIQARLEKTRGALSLGAGSLQGALSAGGEPGRLTVLGEDPP